MADKKKVRRRRIPSGQEMDRQYDEVHEEPGGDEPATPERQRRDKQHELDAYAEELKGPD
jgi:hypothetical protein